MTAIATAPHRPSVPEGWRVARARIGADSPDLATAPVVNPAAHADVVGEYALGGPAQVDAAVRCATAAFGTWSRRTAAGRASTLLAAAEAVDDLAAAAVPVLSLEIGKVPAESRVDAGGAAMMLRRYAAMAEAADVAEIHAGPGHTVRVTHRPLGPVAVICPWNAPVFLTFAALAPALATGCTVVVKPPEDAPLALTAMLHALADALPEGVLGVVPGRGAEAGAALAAHPGVRGVFFTGGVETGIEVARAAAGTVKKLTLELGGNDPALVLESAEITETVLRELVAGSFASSGQVCQNVKRIYVHRRHHTALRDGLADLVGQLRVGDPFLPGAHMGPVTTAAGHRRADELLASVRTAGATVVETGVRLDPDGWDRGWFVAPTLVSGLAPDHPLVLIEQFCPILPIVAFDDDETAITEANRTEYGLSASVWSADLDHAHSVASRIESGSVFVNVHRLGASVEAAPFGGVKRSGLGRNHGIDSLRNTTEPHAVIAWEDASTTLPGLDRWPGGAS